MNIIILGAGQVGSSLAENLASEDNDITVIDTDANRLRTLQNRLDIATVQGSGSYPTILREAGAEDADMLIAVTNNDEANIVACQVAYTVFNIPTKIARIRAQELSTQSELFRNEAAPIDMLISPEQQVTRYIKKLIDYPGTLQVLDFADGKVQLVTIKPRRGGMLVGKKLNDIKTLLPNIELRITAIFRNNQSIKLTGDTPIYADDEVFFIAPSDDTKAVMYALGHLEKPFERIIIAGGGNIGERLASSLEATCQVKVIEHNEERAQQIADRLNKSVVLQGDAADSQLLIDENIENIDVFCAVTNDDEANIMSCLQAKRLGARQVMALVTRTNYVDLIQGGEIDIAISPQLATIGSILQYLRGGDIVKVHSLRRGAAEAMEAIAHGDNENSRVIGRAIHEIPLPDNVNIAAIVRGDEVMMAKSDIIIEAEDHVILFLTDKKLIGKVEKLFKVRKKLL